MGWFRKKVSKLKDVVGDKKFIRTNSDLIQDTVVNHHAEVAYEVNKIRDMMQYLEMYENKLHELKKYITKTVNLDAHVILKSIKELDSMVFSIEKMTRGLLKREHKFLE